MSSKAEQILAGLGGAENIVEIEACITRLRTEVEDGALVDEKALKAAGAHGVDQVRQRRAGRRRPRGGQPGRRHRGPDVTRGARALAGRLLPLSEVPDPVFAAEMVGPGVAVDPATPANRHRGRPRSPGPLVKVHPHAFVVLGPDGSASWSTSGIDTVRPRGAGASSCTSTRAAPWRPAIRWSRGTVRHPRRGALARRTRAS